MGARREPSAAVDRRTEVIAVTDARHAGVHADTHLEGEPGCGFEERELHVDCCLDSLDRRLKCHSEAVACGAEDVTIVPVDDRADPLVVLGERLCHRIGGVIPERGRSLDVGEQERDIARWRVRL